MKKWLRHITILVVIVGFSAFGTAQTSVISIGLRGGGQMWLPVMVDGVDAALNGKVGGSGGVDLRYSFYGDLTESFSLGLALGAGIGYGAAGIKGSNTDRFQNTDYLGNLIDYTAGAVFSQTEQFARADIALLLAMKAGGFRLNAGPKLMIPFAAKRSMNISEAEIDAYYSEYDVHIVNELVTGKLGTPFSQTSAAALPQWNLMGAVEMGWEWQLGTKNSLGVQVYVDFPLWNSWKVDRKSVV